LTRIGFLGEVRHGLSTLQRLQKAHLLHVRFENLDIHWGNPIKLDIEKIFHKVVARNRGGFCYELNGLFYVLLQSLDFQLKRISARVYSEEKRLGEEYDHLAIIAHLSEMDYLVDVGFGEFTMCFLNMPGNAIFFAFLWDL